MKFARFFIVVTILVTAASFNAGGQEITYPKEVEFIFKKADAASTPITSPRPVIALPAGCTQYTSADVLAAGGLPVVLPVDENDFNTLRSLVADIDGFVLSKEFAAQVEKEISGNEAPAILLLKAVVDRNVPTFGSTPLLVKINKGLGRQKSGITTLEGLVSKASTYRKAKQVMDRAVSLDTHCDQPVAVAKGNASAGVRRTNQVSIQKMDESGLDAQFLAAFVSSGSLGKASLAKAYEKCSSIIDKTVEDVSQYPQYCALARTSDEIRSLKSQGKKAFLLAVENGYGLGGDLSNIKKFADRGVTYITLCHTRDNDICHTSSKYSKNTSLGLTEFGREVVAEMNRQGVIIDVSHASEGTFWDVCKYSKAPFVCTHSGASGVYKHNRSLTDKQLRALAEKGGVIQVYLIWNFMGNDINKTSIDDMVKHIDHCVKVAGVDHVGIGSDFDGGGGGIGYMGQNDFINVVVKLLELGYSESDLTKILGGNFLRVMDQVQAMAER